MLDPGKPITKELIAAADPEELLQHIAGLAQRAASAEDLVAELRTQIEAQKSPDQSASAGPDRDSGPPNPLQEGSDEDLISAVARAEALARENVDLKRQLADGNAQRSSLITGQDEALRAYRDMVLQREPQLPPDLVSGGTLNDLNASIEGARTIVAHVQKALQQSNDASRVPAGAPMRTIQPDVATLTPAEKILYGVRVARGEEVA